MEYFKRLVNNAPGEVFVIAEACDNHMGSFEMAKSLARAALASGANAVKFQHHIVEKEMLNNDLSSSNFSESLYDFLVVNALSIDQHYALKEYCDKIGITYLCTPFSIDAAHEIEPLVPFFKIGSGEFLDFWFIDQLQSLNKPIIFSSGMSSDAEVDTFLRRYLGKLDFALLNCLSEYPPKYSDLNLGYIKTLQTKGDFVVGHSDHTPTIASSIAAVAFGAQIIEKHITLSDHVDGPDASVSLNPHNFRLLTEAVTVIREAIGVTKKINDLEVPIRQWAHRSIVAAKDLTAGQKISVADLCTKRPGTGIPSSRYEEFIGKVVAIDIPYNTVISEGMLQ